MLTSWSDPRKSSPKHLGCSLDGVQVTYPLLPQQPREAEIVHLSLLLQQNYRNMHPHRNDKYSIPHHYLIVTFFFTFIIIFFIYKNIFMGMDQYSNDAGFEDNESKVTSEIIWSNVLLLQKRIFIPK